MGFGISVNHKKENKRKQGFKNIWNLVENWKARMNESYRDTSRRCTLVNMYHRTNVFCCKERSLQKNNYSNSKVREENIAVVFIQLWSLQLEKFIFVASFFSLPIGGDGV